MGYLYGGLAADLVEGCTYLALPLDSWTPRKVSTVADTARFVATSGCEASPSFWDFSHRICDDSAQVRMLMNKGKLDDGQRFLSSSSVTALEKNRMKEGADPASWPDWCLGQIGLVEREHCHRVEFGFNTCCCLCRRHMPN